MKRFFFVSLILVSAFFLLVGCQTTETLKSSITSKVTSFTSDVDPELYAQVPEDQREGFQEAESNMKLLEEKLKLAELKKDLASAREEYAGYTQDLAEKDLTAAVLNLDIVKLEAIDRAELGKKEKNIKNIAKLKTKKHEAEGDRINIEAKVTIAERKIKDLTQQIKEQEEKIGGMTSNVAETDETVSEPPVDEAKDQGTPPAEAEDEGKTEEPKPAE
jgi:chromosome segregation ATPase